jgi:hypothetical protein
MKLFGLFFHSETEERERKRKEMKKKTNIPNQTENVL